jgi:hypothetical protein
MNMRRERAIKIGIIAGVVILTQFLYPYAISHGKPNYIFGGIYFNPYDGYSYLSKMYQGWQGFWKFYLLYSPEQGHGSYLFLFYLFLGHISRWTGLSLPTTFHLARLFTTTLFFLILFNFLKMVLVDSRLYLSAYCLTAFGSGLGWLGLLFNKITPDFWVAEAYPFLSSFANPHFPLGLAILLWIFSSKNLEDLKISPKKALGLFISSLLLAVVLPFGVVISIAVLLLSAVFEYFIHILNKDKKSFQNYRFLGLEILFVILGGMPMLLYQFWLTRNDSLLSIWNIQNVTPSPNIGELVIALLPAGILAIAGFFGAMKEKNYNSIRIQMWALVGIGCTYIPFLLQRRLLMGVYLPVVVLAVLGIDYVVRTFFGANNKSKIYNYIALTLFLLSVPTNIIIISFTKNAIDRLDSMLYLKSSEVEAFKWLAENAPQQSIILSSPESGLFIPAYTGQHVIYGHPFESINADISKQFVIDFYTRMIASRDMDKIHRSLFEYRVDYIYMGPREKRLTIEDFSPFLQEQFDQVFQNADVKIFRIIK